MKRQKKLRLSGSLCRVFRLPCVKGAPPQAVRDCFFYNTPTASRFPNPSRRGLQVCFAHSQILQPLRGFRTPLGEACKCASHTRKSLQPLRGFRTPLGEACKRASHTRKSLYTREPFYQLCFSSIFFLISYLKKARLSGGLFVSLFCVCCGFFNRRFFGSFCGFL